MKQIKKIVKEICLYLLDWADESEISKVHIDKSVFFDVSKLLPKKNKWYHIAYTVSFYLKRNEENVEETDEVIS